VCNLHQIPASLTLKKLTILLLLPVCGIGGSEVLRGVSASEARSSPILAVDLTFLALLRGMPPESCL
jgi:hypothetical protein